MPNCVYVMATMRNLCISSPYLALAGKHGKRHDMSAHKHQAVSDWLNPHPLVAMSAFSYIEKLAKNSTCLINYQEITRSI